MNKEDMKKQASIGMAICSIFILIGAIAGVWGLIVPVVLYFLATSAQQ